MSCGDLDGYGWYLPIDGIVTLLLGFGAKSYQETKKEEEEDGASFRRRPHRLLDDVLEFPAFHGPPNIPRKNLIDMAVSFFRTE